MAVKQVTVNVSAGLYDGGQALGKLWKKIQEQLANGFQPGDDLPPIITEAVKDVAQVAQAGVGAVGEYQENHQAAANAVALGVVAALVPET